MSKRNRSTLAVLWILFLAPALLQAGVNEWTGGGSLWGPGGATFVAADPLHPNIVYAISLPEDVYRSADGGQSWTRIGSFFTPRALLVDPASPSTLYLSTTVSEPYDVYWGVLKSTDSGLTWNKTTRLSGPPFALASSPTGSTLYGGGAGFVIKSEDAGGHWTRHDLPLELPLEQEFEALALDPKNDQTVYAGGGKYSVFSGLMGRVLVKSTDGGATWTDLSARLAVGRAPVRTIAIDRANPSTLFAGFDGEPWLLRSADGGDSWAPAVNGLPAGAPVYSLIVDPTNSLLMYAGSHGVYKTSDGGATWFPIGQHLMDVDAISLAIDGSGRFLHAATALGVFDLEMRDGGRPLDVASGAAGQAHILAGDGVGLSVLQLDGSGNWTTTPFGGGNATAISDGSDGLSRVLWKDPLGPVDLLIVGAAGRQAFFGLWTPAGWTSLDLSVGTGDDTHLLWTSAKGEMRITSTDSAGSTTEGPTYGPYAGWSACAIADGPDGATWVLWRSSDGAAGIARYRDGTFETAFHWSPNPGWAAEDIAVGSDGLPRVLWTNGDGRMGIGTVDGQGRMFDRRTYSSPGQQPRRIGTSSDGLTRVLWTGAGNDGSLWLLNPDNSIESERPTPENF